MKLGCVGSQRSLDSGRLNFFVGFMGLQWPNCESFDHVLF
jgi:hypothetical protein